MGEADVLELREGREEVTGEPTIGRVAILVPRPDAATEVIDGVIAAPQNPVVFRQPVVGGTDSTCR